MSYPPTYSTSNAPAYAPPPVVPKALLSSTKSATPVANALGMKSTTAYQALSRYVTEIEASSSNKLLLVATVLGFIGFWAPMGHPITEYHIVTRVFEGVIDKNIAAFGPEERALINTFADRFAMAMISTYDNPSLLLNPLDNKPYATDVQYNNFHSIRIHCVAYMGRFLGIQAYLDWAHTMLLKQVGDNLNPDGTSYDLVHRDSIGYHVYNMRPLVKAADILRSTPAYKDVDYYTYKASNGASIQQSVRYLIPYVLGEKENYMLAKSSLKSDTNSTNYNKRWPPEDARALFLDAAKYDDEIARVARQMWPARR